MASISEELHRPHCLVLTFVNRDALDGMTAFPIPFPHCTVGTGGHHLPSKVDNARGDLRVPDTGCDMLADCSSQLASRTVTVWIYSPITDAPDLDRASNRASGNVSVVLDPSEDTNHAVML
jgi:hypothetical protein